jgi:hypothetical protein
MVRRFSIACALLFATTAAADAPAFGPFDAGSVRAVDRQGTRGTPRRAHPVVGDVDHIPGGGTPRPKLRRDPDVPEAALSGANSTPGITSNPLYLASLFYSNFLTRTDGPRCQHLPTCSRFASQAVGRHGLIGISLGLDRLLQGGTSSAVRNLPDIEFGDGLRHYDPVDNYEFWVTARFTGFPTPTPEAAVPVAAAPAATAASAASTTTSVADHP